LHLTIKDLVLYNNLVYFKNYLSSAHDAILLKDIEISLDSKQIRPNYEFHGTIKVNYSGKYDSVVLNTQILSSNELMLFTSCNGKKMNSRSARLFISKDVMPNNSAEFTATITFEPKEKHEIKFRASIIEQHKEIESDVLFADYS
jgi:hypothetical protein